MDEKVLERIQDGDKAAFEDFANGAIPRLYRAAFRILRDHDSSEDVVQMTLVRFLENVKKIEHRSVWGWLYKVMSNLAKDEMRRSRRKVELKEEILSGRYNEPVEAISRKNMTEKVGAALTKLGKKSRAVVLMRMEGFSYSEIASELAISEGSAKVLFLKSVRKLAKIVEAG